MAARVCFRLLSAFITVLSFISAAKGVSSISRSMYGKHAHVHSKQACLGRLHVNMSRGIACRPALHTTVKLTRTVHMECALTSCESAADASSVMSCWQDLCGPLGTSLRHTAAAAYLLLCSAHSVCGSGVELDQLQAQEQPGGSHRLHQHSHCLPRRLPLCLRWQGGASFSLCHPCLSC